MLNFKKIIIISICFYVTTLFAGAKEKAAPGQIYLAGVNYYADFDNSKYCARINDETPNQMENWYRFGEKCTQTIRNMIISYNNSDLGKLFSNAVGYADDVDIDFLYGGWDELIDTLIKEEINSK